MSDIHDFVIEEGKLKKYTGTDTNVVIPEGVSKIVWGAFEGCESIQEVMIGPYVSEICTGAFNGCKNLKTVYILNGGVHNGIVCLPVKLWSSIYDRKYSSNIRTYSWKISSENKIFSGGYFPVLDEQYESWDDFFITKENGNIYLGTHDNPYLIFVDTEDKSPTEITINPTTRAINKKDNTSKMDKCILRDYYKLEKITWLSTEFVNLDVDLKMLCVLGFVEASYSGKKIEKDVASAYTKYTRSQRKKLYPLMPHNNALFYFMLENGIVAKEYIDDVFNEVKKTGDNEKISAMLPYVSNSNNEVENLTALSISLDLSVTEAKKDWLFESTKEGVKILGYKGKEAEVTVPDKIGGLPVTIIDQYAFSPERPRVLSAIKPYLKSIKKVYLPLTVTRIENNAFEECVSLETIISPSTLVFVGDLAFKNCENLSFFEMPTAEIDFKNAFLGCRNMSNKEGLVIINGTLVAMTSKKKKTIIIDKTVTKVNVRVFGSQLECSKDTEVRVKVESAETTIYIDEKPSINSNVYSATKGRNTIVIMASSGSNAQRFVDELPIESQKYIKFEEM